MTRVLARAHFVSDVEETLKFLLDESRQSVAIVHACGFGAERRQVIAYDLYTTPSAGVLGA